MGFKTATMVSPTMLKSKALVWHRRMAELCHQHGCLYCLHACGNLEAIMEALIEDVGLDGRHSFEDAIEPVTVAKRRWGDRLSLLGGIDVDFLTRARPTEVRRRVRDTLDACMVGGGYCLGTGNSVANYIPIENFLTMLDEGRRYAA
jgi:uroporphyrinogen decarboxylase